VLFDTNQSKKEEREEGAFDAALISTTHSSARHFLLMLGECDVVATVCQNSRAK
jgi:hypothetical protein